MKSFGDFVFYHPHWCGLKKCHVCWQRRYRFYNRHQVTVTPATGHIYIGDRNNHHIKILNSDLTVFHLIGSAEAIDIQGFLYVHM